MTDSDPYRNVFAYIGKKRGCGCVVAIVVDDPLYVKQTAKDVSDFIKAGYDVERVSLAEGVQQVHSCPHVTKAVAATSGHPQGALL